MQNVVFDLRLILVLSSNLYRLFACLGLSWVVHVLDHSSLCLILKIEIWPLSIISSSFMLLSYAWAQRLQALHGLRLVIADVNVLNTLLWGLIVYFLVFYVSLALLGITDNFNAVWVAAGRSWVAHLVVFGARAAMVRSMRRWLINVGWWCLFVSVRGRPRWWWIWAAVAAEFVPGALNIIVNLTRRVQRRPTQLQHSLVENIVLILLVTLSLFCALKWQLLGRKNLLNMWSINHFFRND